MVVISGYKLCPTCRGKVSDLVNTREHEEHDQACNGHELSGQFEKESLSFVLGELEVSSLKLYAVQHHANVSNGKY